LVAALEPGLGQVNLFDGADRTGCYCCGLPDPRRHRWQDGGGCTLAHLESQRIVSALATKLAVNSLAGIENTYDQLIYDVEPMAIRKQKRCRSMRCWLCGPDGAAARQLSDAATSIMSVLFADDE